MWKGCQNGRYNNGESFFPWEQKEKMIWKEDQKKGERRTETTMIIPKKRMKTSFRKKLGNDTHLKKRF